MIELVSALSIRMRRCEGDDPISEPFGKDPAPMMAVRGLIVAFKATLSKRVWCRCGIGSSVELSSVSESKADRVSRRLSRLVSDNGERGSGKDGDSGGERTEVSETRLP